METARSIRTLRTSLSSWGTLRLRCSQSVVSPLSGPSLGSTTSCGGSRSRWGKGACPSLETVSSRSATLPQPQFRHVEVEVKASAPTYKPVFASCFQRDCSLNWTKAMGQDCAVINGTDQQVSTCLRSLNYSAGPEFRRGMDNITFSRLGLQLARMTNGYHSHGAVERGIQTP